MTLTQLVKRTEQIFRNNSPVIMAAIGVSGTLSTAYLTGKASFYAAQDIDLVQTRENRKMSNKEKVKIVWKLYIPAAVSGVTTVACIVGSARVGTRRTAAAYSMLSVSEKAFTEYKDKVVETIGERKERSIQDSVAQDRVNANPASTREVIITGGGNVLCCELFTGRYLQSDFETLRKAQNDVNAKIFSQNYVTLSDFYEMIGLPITSNSWNVGWDSSKMMELSFSTVLSEDQRPCIAFNYNYIKNI